MSDSRSDLPIPSETSRTMFIGWGVDLLLMVAAYYIGGSFFPFLGVCLAVVMILRGIAPKLFANHFDAQPIAGIPYRREESLAKWAVAIGLCIAISLAGSLAYQRWVPSKPSIVVSILDGVRKIVNESLDSRSIVAPSSPISTPAPKVLEYKKPASPIKKTLDSTVRSCEEVIEHCSDGELADKASVLHKRIEKLISKWQTRHNDYQASLAGRPYGKPPGERQRQFMAQDDAKMSGEIAQEYSEHYQNQSIDLIDEVFSRYVPESQFSTMFMYERQDSSIPTIFQISKTLKYCEDLIMNPQHVAVRP